MNFSYNDSVAKRELTPHQQAVLQWIADGCPETDWGEQTYKNSARMLAGHNLVKIRGHGKTWQATATERGRRVLAEDEPLVPEKKSKTGDRANTNPSPARRIVKPAPAPPPRLGSAEQVKKDLEDLYQRLVEAEFNIVAGLPVKDDAMDWGYLAERLRSFPLVKENNWRVSTRTRILGHWNEPRKEVLDIALVPQDVWLTTSPEVNSTKERIGRYHPAVSEVMAYSTNITGALKPRARRLLHSLFTEAEARGFTHGRFDVGTYGSYSSARERGSLRAKDTGYGFNDGFNNYFVAASEQVDIVERPPTKEELKWHERDLRWYPNAKLKKFYDHPYNGKILITIAGRQAKDTKRKTAEQRLLEMLAAMSLEQAWKKYDREMKRRAEALWQKKLAIAEGRADEWIKNESFHNTLQERANAWDQYKRVEIYVGDLRREIDQSGEDDSSSREWLAWCEEHLEETNPMRHKGLPVVKQPSHVDRQKIVENIARKIRDISST